MGRPSALVTHRPPILAEPRERSEPHQTTTTTTTTTTCPETAKREAEAEAKFWDAVHNENQYSNSRQEQKQKQKQEGEEGVKNGIRSDSDKDQGQDQDRNQSQENKNKDKDKRHDVETTINYWKDPGDGSLPTPVNVSDDTVTNKRPTVPQRVMVRDVTGNEAAYALDTAAFQFRRHSSALRELDEFRDGARVRDVYYPECARLLKDVTGASRVFVFDHRTRCGPSNWHSLGKGNAESRGPLLRAHVDQSYDGAEMVLRRWFPDEADELIKRRYQIINVWRPIKTILKDPLAVTDAASVPDSDLVPAAIIYPTYRSETWTVRAPGPDSTSQHRWYYKYRQEPGEVLLIKCFDSRTDVARRALHSAFEDLEQAGAPYRESIEARALLFYDE